MKDVVIVSACRTAIGTFGGTLKDIILANLGAVAMREAVKRAGIDPATIDDVRFGCCMEHVNTLNVTRTAALLAGIPDTVTAVTINRVCPSGMEATASGTAMIQAGMADIVLVGGMEHMSGVPYSSLEARWGCRLQDKTLVDCIIRGLHCGSYVQPLSDDSPVKASPLFDMFKGKPYIMGQTAEFIASLYNISREEMDEVALKSHNSAERATKEGDFADEIVPVEIPNKKKGKPPIIFDKDEHFRPNLTMQELKDLPPAFIPKTGKVTAGNSSGINDGASAMVIMSADKAKELGIKPLAKIRSIGRGGCHPSVMGLSPTPAVKKLLQNDPKLTIDSFDLIEVNEAFAAQYIGCERDLGFKRDKANVNGSGIGLGHPVGSTGCRIILTLMYALRKRGKNLGLATICGGGGVGMATAIEIL
jgi:acetyl-CoA C-acetyltransferase